jgi:hypothetical protein
MPTRREFMALQDRAIHVDGYRTGFGAGLDGEQFHGWIDPALCFMAPTP